MNKTAESIITVLKNVLPEKSSIPLHEPFFDGNEKKYIMECLETRFVSSIGSYVDQFERDLAYYTSSPFAVAVVNGTAALHISLLMAGVQPDDEVLVPAVTFVASANAISYCNAYPHFIDSRSDNLGIDVDKLELYLKKKTRIKNNTCINKITGRKIKAVIAVHVFGMPVEMDSLIELCRKFNLNVVEDAAESLGSFYKGKHTGTFGICGALSFNGNKIITTGGGGAILCQDETVAELAKHITTTAKAQKYGHFYHDRLGFNYRMPNINAAMGCAQLEQMPLFLAQKRSLARRYQDSFKSVKGISILTEPPHSESNYWLNTLLLDKPDKELLQNIIDITNEKGIQTRPLWTLIKKLPIYTNCQSMDLGCAMDLEKRVINIPSSINLNK